MPCTYQLRIPYKKLKKGTNVNVKRVNEEKLPFESTAVTNNGEIPLPCLFPKDPMKMKDASDIEKRIFQLYGLKEDVAAVKRTSLEAGYHVIMNCSRQGHFSVVQPTDWPNVKDSWPCFLLAVRNVTGCVDQYTLESGYDVAYNELFPELPVWFTRSPAQQLAYTQKRAVLVDNAFNRPSAVPPVVYFRINRTKIGQFYIEESATFANLELLLSNYYDKLLPMGRNACFKLCLTRSLLSTTGQTCSVCPSPFVEFKETPKMCVPPIDMPVISEAKFEDYSPRLYTRMSVKNTEKKEAQLGVIAIDGDFSKVCFMFAPNAKYYDKEALNEDIKAINAVAKKSNQLDIGQITGIDNVVHCIDAGINANGFWAIFDYVEGMPLNRVLQKKRTVGAEMTPRHQTEIAYQVACGMAFLELNGLCHRQLRGSKIFVTLESQAMSVVRVADFMISHHFLLAKDAKYDEETLGWPWMAPEALNAFKFDIVADVWSFGCVVFEILTFGKTPHSYEKSMDAVKDLKAFFEKKKEMDFGEIPDDCGLKKLAQKCLQYEAMKRPKFGELQAKLSEVLFNPVALATHSEAIKTTKSSAKISANKNKEN